MMTNRDLHESNLTISGAIILGAFIIAWAIMSAAGDRAASELTKTGAANPSPSAALQAAGQGVVDMRSIKTVGEPMIGSATAPITIAYWFDYQCPYCKQNEEVVMPALIKDYIDAGKVRVIFKDFPFLGPDSEKLAIAARAVWEVAPAKFYAWHKAIFDAQGQENTGWATDAKIASVTEGALGAADAAKVASLEVSKATQYEAAIAADKAEGVAFGVQGTPASVIGTAKGGSLVTGAQPYSNLKSRLDALRTE